MKPFILVDQSMPAVLTVIPQPPHELHVLSDNWEDLTARPAVAIVGSRRPTSYGIAVTQRLASDLARQGVVIVSGLALGIDSIAHKAALDVGGVTIAVLPSGIHNIYPATHASLANKIARQGGALVSEYTNDSARPHRFQFVERNRLIAGLSKLVVITEASIKSGSRHTADFARDQGKDVMAVPGRIDMPSSGGTNQQIAEGAGIVLSSQSVFDALGLRAVPTYCLKLSNPAQQTVFDLLTSGVSLMSELQYRSKLSVQQLNHTLTLLEISGHVTRQPNGQWYLTPP